MHQYCSETCGKMKSKSPGMPFGMTMIELIVAVAILAVLAGVSIPVTQGVLRKAKINSTKSEMASLSRSILTHAKDVGYKPARVEWGRFPSEKAGNGKYKTILGADLEEDLFSLGWDPVTRRGWNGPYVTGETVNGDADGDGNEDTARSYQIDGWGRYYIYSNRDGKGNTVGLNDEERVIILISGGPDMDPQTTDDNITLEVFRGPIY
ncbi:MAG: prepilin-type N-terminal cleavage/methylation domain-containing protein [Candidatus Eisenbacteria bacterium]|nr:prepilin-type N-terminal cleavage/methylation domain-containing protein [Candidatus Eisenbacteria bacterium]MBU1949909.1 prepilin-type N-terminal cleavage/methylation domain-containing protein [Candidatus Eisenbacteria bacterium]